jgi:hypothetical protein
MMHQIVTDFKIVYHSLMNEVLFKPLITFFYVH